MTPAASRPRSLADQEPFVVELDRFHGPLDLLLHLIRSQDIDIFDIPIARVTEQFQTSLRAGLDRLELGRAGEFLEMAATLVRIKAQLLLPRGGEPDWEDDPRADLVRRLLEYEHYQEVAQVLSSAEADRSRHFEKGYIEPRRAPDRYLPALETTLPEFLEAAGEVPEPRPTEPPAPPTREVTVEEKMSLARKLLREAERIAFERLYEPWGLRLHAVSALLACLELARHQIVRLEQAVLFGPIWILPGRRPDAEVRGDPAVSEAVAAGAVSAGSGSPEGGEGSGG